MIIVKILNVIDSVSYIVGQLITTLVLIAGTLLCVEVVARYIFNSPIMWIPFVTTEICAVFYFLVGAYTLRFKAHVGMDVFYERLSKKNQNITEMVTFIFFMIFVSILLWYGYEEMLFSVKIRETTPPPWYGPLWPVKIFFVLGCAMLLVQGVANFCRNIIAVLGKEAL